MISTTSNAKSCRFIPSLRTTRAPPKTLEIQYDHEGHRYLFDPRVKHRRTSLPIPGTGTPNDEHTEMERQDLHSFLLLLRSESLGELIPLAEYISKLLHLQESTRSDILFERPLSSIFLRVGQEPVLRFHCTREESIHEETVSKQNCDISITSELLMKLCEGLQFCNTRGKTKQDFNESMVVCYLIAIYNTIYYY